MYFDSRDERYKRPYGALRAGERLRLFIEAQSPLCGMRLVLAPDGGAERVYEMEPTSGGFSLCLSIKESGLYFYRFEGVLETGRFQFIGRGAGGKAVAGDWLPRFQLTVYDADFKTPEKFAGGILYQIFPDRFAKEGDRAAHPIRHDDPNEPPLDYTDPRGGLDFYGGNLAGVRQKLPYLAELGVSAIYFNPIFESAENHRYSTSDYLAVDPDFGTNAEFADFCKQAKTYGIDVILDGVFSHTGADSVYFDKYGHYGGKGAFADPDSPYRSWYDFTDYPNEYASWWGFQNLPNVKETDPAYLEFITGRDGVLAHWQALGAAGWRLDVADELPDAFLEALRARVKAQDPDALIIGEVWENAVRKESYGARRKFLLGKQCDSVMNYPWRKAIIQLVCTGNVPEFAEAVNEICEEYPAPVLDVLMNMLSTHDSARILTALTEDGADEQTAAGRMRQAALLQFTLPGIPSIYYGDEIGMRGARDPFNRAFYDWSGGDKALRAFYKELGALRRAHRTDFTAPLVFTDLGAHTLRYRRGALEIAFDFAGGQPETDGKILLETKGAVINYSQNAY